MAGFASQTCGVFITTMTILTWCVCSQSCPINSKCSCSSQNETDISCTNLPTLNNTTFTPSSVRFRSLRIHVPPQISRIPERTFSGLYINNIYVTYSPGISTIDCTAFSGLEQSLTLLSLVTNKLARVPTCALKIISKLKTLVLRNTQIRQVLQDDFIHSRNLESLTIIYSNTEYLSEGSFKPLISLKILELYGNRISVLLPGVFDNLSELTVLDLRYNYIQDLKPSLFNNNTKLRTLHSSHNKLRFLDLNILRTLPLLPTIDMTNNNISSLQPMTQTDRSSANNPSIVAIVLKNNRISRIEAGTFATLGKLTTVDLSDNEIEELTAGVFTNSPSVNYLRLQNNKIRKIHPDAFEDFYPALYELNLFGNPLTEKSASDLLNIIPSFTRMSNLYLSDVSLPPLSRAAMILLRKSLYLQLRNCSIPDYPDFNINGTMRWRNVDLSGNMLSVFGTKVKPMTLTSAFGTANVNISHNTVQHVNVTVLRIYVLNFDAENNKIKDFTINITSYATNGNVNSLTVKLRENHINKKIQIIGPLKDVSVDLSKNRITDVTEFPITMYSSNGSVQWDPCLSSSIRVNRLNLSGNAIETISPSVCLSAVKSLDLSHNQLKVIGKLADGSPSTNVRLTTLYLNGNQLHQISTDSFQRFEGILSRIDLRSNQLKTLPNMVNFVSNTSFVGLYLENNPLNCSCDLDWLRDTSVSVTKIVDARCAEPVKSRAHLLICVELDSCKPDELPLLPPSSGATICRGDNYVEITNLTSMYSTENRTMTVTWLTYGPGTIVEFQVVYHQANNEDVSKTKTVFPGPDFHSVLLSDLDFGHSYQICVTAIVHRNILYTTSCVDTITGCCRETKPVPVVTIALGVALGICVMVIIVLTLCIVKCRSRVSMKTKRKTLNELYLPSTQRQNESGNDNGERTPDETYEDIRASQIYVN